MPFRKYVLHVLLVFKPFPDNNPFIEELNTELKPFQYIDQT